MSFSANIFGRDSAIFKLGNVLGLGIPGWLDRQANPEMEPQMADIAIQTSKEGGPIPIVWGRVRPIGGNLIATSEVRRVRKKQKSGKGGGSSSSQETETLYRTYAMGVCEGPGIEFRRIWRNSKLVYDGRLGSAWGAKNNGTFLARARFYSGSWEQMPDPSLEAKLGIGNVSAHRGLAYMVMSDENVTDTGGAVPQWQFEVARPEGIYLTSRPYPVEVIEELDSADATLTSVSAPLVNVGVEPESLESDQTLEAINFRSVLAKYLYEESLNADQTLEAMSFRSVLIPYEIPAESLDSSQTLESIAHRVALIQYENYPPESLDSNQTLEAIHHANP